MRELWSVSPEWRGETAFIVAGGPSVAEQNVELLRGRRVIVINSTWRRVPFADYLFYGDPRWWDEYGRDVLAEFRGQIVSVDPRDNHRVLRLQKKLADVSGLSDDPTSVMMTRTSTAGAINMAVHLGCSDIVSLGVDNGPSADGRTHHHAPHPWNQRISCWDVQAREFEIVAASLKERGIPLINASPGTKLDYLWPVMPLAGAIEYLDRRRAA